MRTSKDKKLFIQLIEKNKAIIYKISYSYCKNTNDLDDLVQEIIYNLWKSFDRYNTEYKFSTWMYRIALNVAISYYKKELKLGENISINETILEINEQLNNETEDRINQLQYFISQLRDIDKSIMLLYLEEKSYKEISEITGITETNVATKIGRIKEKLKVDFKNQQNIELWK